MPDAVDKTPPTGNELSARRAAELAALMDTHRANVAQAHDMYPTPPGVGFGDMRPDEQRLWNSKRAHVDMANVAYARAVKLACSRHRDEDLAERAKFTKTWREKMEAEARDETVAKPPASASNDETSLDHREGADK